MRKMRSKTPSRLNKTKRLEIPVTPALFQSVKDCAHKLGVKHTDWARGVLANAVMVCLKPTDPSAQEANE